MAAVGARWAAAGCRWVRGAKAAVMTSVKGLMSFQPSQVTGWRWNLTSFPGQPLGDRQAPVCRCPEPARRGGLSWGNSEASGPRGRGQAAQSLLLGLTEAVYKALL